MRSRFHEETGDNLDLDSLTILYYMNTILIMCSISYEKWVS